MAHADLSWGAAVFVGTAARCLGGLQGKYADDKVEDVCLNSFTLAQSLSMA